MRNLFPFYFYVTTIPVYFGLFAHTIFWREPEPMARTDVLAWVACIVFALLWPLVILGALCRGVYNLVREG